jgi:asparagine synthase (glutamine-hydrolysing)
MPTDIDNVNIKPKPHLGVHVAGGRAQAQGEFCCRLGQRIPVTGQRGDEGVFLHWDWDGSKLTVQNDRYGLYPLFYCARADSIWVSPSLEHVVRGNSQRRLDLPALAVFHRLGHFVGEDTPFQDVHFLPPNTTLTWQGGRLELQTSPSQVGQQEPFDGDFDATVDRYDVLFSRAITRRLPGGARFTVPISGGRDSRHILLELAKQGCVPDFCPTVKYRPPATNEDTRIAGLLTQRLGIRHVEIDKPSSFFAAALNDVHLTNHCGGGHGWVQPVASGLIGRVDSIYDGLAGSVLSGGFMLAQRKLDLFHARNFQTLALEVLEESASEGKLRHVLAPDLYRQLPLGLAVDRVAQELTRHVDTHNPVLSFVFWNRTRRCVASIPFAILHRVPHVHTPYLDHALFDFLFSLDASVVDGNRLHDETIRRAYPAFADLPYEDKRARATFQPEERDYYPQARRELFNYLRQAPAQALRVVQRPYLYAKIGTDLLTRQVDPPWYMRTAIQAIELERLRTE